MDNNKGFSLVELIIVIAIMAVLIGVLAPQFIKYVEKSKESVDVTIMDNAYEAGHAEYADGQLKADTTYYYDGTQITETKPAATYGKGTPSDGEKEYSNPCCDDGKYDSTKDYRGKVLQVTCEPTGEDTSLIHVHWVN